MIRKIFLFLWLSANLLSAAGMLIGCYSHAINEGDYWFLDLFTTVTPLLLMSQPVFLMSWLFLKPRYALISLVALVLCWVPLRQVFGFRIGDPFRYQKAPDHLRIMSWNVEHFKITEHRRNPALKLDMIRVVRNHYPDIACFQEMVASDTFADAINYLPDFQKKMLFPYAHYSYDPRYDFDRRHHFGLVIFSRHPILHSETIQIDRRGYNSIFQLADIVRRGDTFRIVNVHLQSLRFSPNNRTYLKDPGMNDKEDLQESESILRKFKTSYIRRHRQADRVARVIRESPYPVILCGDLNDVPNSYAYALLEKLLGNAFTPKGAGFANTYTGLFQGVRIDHIFADRRLGVSQFTTYRKKLSDHYPIVADLTPAH